MATNGRGAAEREAQKIWRALDGFRIEIPSWGFANTGTRFGKFVQAGAATTIEEKFADAAQVNALTGASPTVALHVLWDLPGGKADVPAIQALEKKYGVGPGGGEGQFSGRLGPGKRSGGGGGNRSTRLFLGGGRKGGLNLIDPFFTP